MKKTPIDGQEILGLLNKLQEQLVSLEQKIDSVLERIPAAAPVPTVTQPAVVPAASSTGAAAPNAPAHGGGQAKGRAMYQAVCADCRKDCELPFKPSGDRPVYCKECFRIRKTSRLPKGAPAAKAEESAPVLAAISAAIDIPETPLKEKRKAPARKTVAKKKPATATKKKK